MGEKILRVRLWDTHREQAKTGAEYTFNSRNEIK